MPEQCWHRDCQHRVRACGRMAAARCARFSRSGALHRLVSVVGVVTHSLLEKQQLLAVILRWAGSAASLFCQAIHCTKARGWVMREGNGRSPEVSIEAPLCPQPAVLRALRRALSAYHPLWLPVVISLRSHSASPTRAVTEG